MSTGTGSTSREQSGQSSMRFMLGDDGSGPQFDNGGQERGRKPLKTDSMVLGVQIQKKPHAIIKQPLLSSPQAAATLQIPSIQPVVTEVEARKKKRVTSRCSALTNRVTTTLKNSLASVTEKATTLWLQVKEKAPFFGTGKKENNTSFTLHTYTQEEIRAVEAQIKALSGGVAVKSELKECAIFLLANCKELLEQMKDEKLKKVAASKLTKALLRYTEALKKFPQIIAHLNRNFKAQTAITFDRPIGKKELLIICGDSFLLNSGYESDQDALKYVKLVKNFLEKSGRPVANPKLLAILDDAIDLSVERDDLEVVVQAKIKKNGKCLLLGGWIGHAISFIIEDDKVNHGKSQVTLYNRGNGSEFHPFGIGEKGRKIKSQDSLEISCVDPDVLFKAGWLRQLQALNAVSGRKYSLAAAEILYEQLIPLHGGKISLLDIDIAPLSTGQRSGTCQWKRLFAFLAREMGKTEAKLFKFHFKMALLDNYMGELQKKAQSKQGITKEDIEGLARVKEKISTAIAKVQSDETLSKLISPAEVQTALALIEQVDELITQVNAKSLVVQRAQDRRVANLACLRNGLACFIHGSGSLRPVAQIVQDICLAALTRLNGDFAFRIKDSSFSFLLGGMLSELPSSCFYFAAPIILPTVNPEVLPGEAALSIQLPLENQILKWRPTAQTIAADIGKFKKMISEAKGANKYKEVVDFFDRFVAKLIRHDPSNNKLWNALTAEQVCQVLVELRTIAMWASSCLSSAISAHAVDRAYGCKETNVIAHLHILAIMNTIASKLPADETLFYTYPNSEPNNPRQFHAMAIPTSRLGGQIASSLFENSSFRLLHNPEYNRYLSQIERQYLWGEERAIFTIQDELIRKSIRKEGEGEGIINTEGVGIFTAFFKVMKKWLENKENEKKAKRIIDPILGGRTFPSSFDSLAEVEKIVEIAKHYKEILPVPFQCLFAQACELYKSYNIMSHDSQLLDRKLREIPLNYERMKESPLSNRVRQDEHLSEHYSHLLFMATFPPFKDKSLELLTHFILEKRQSENEILAACHQEKRGWICRLLLQAHSIAFDSLLIML